MLSVQKSCKFKRLYCLYIWQYYRVLSYYYSVTLECFSQIYGEFIPILK